jgi:hypothetical protein
MKVDTHVRRASFSVAIIFAVVIAVPAAAGAAPITLRSGAGVDAASIQAVVDLFRADLGGVNNGNTPGSLASGRREINWDGGGAAANATIFPSPMTTFNSGATTRGAVFTTPGTGFEISGQPNPEFGDINPQYPNNFTTFSSPRLFSPLGSNITDVFFFEPGTNNPATVTGFGAVFTDVDLINGVNHTSVEFFNAANVSLGIFLVPTFNNGLSFLGATFADPIFRVRLTTGTEPLGRNDNADIDVVAMDDFIYSEPQSIVPEPGSLLLLGSGVAAVAMYRRRRSRA